MKSGKEHNPVLLVFMVQNPVLPSATACVCVCVCVCICTVTCMGEPVILLFSMFFGIAVQAAVFEGIVGQSQIIK